MFTIFSEQLEAAVGKVKIQKPVIDYLGFSPKDPDLDEDKYGDRKSVV